MHRNAPHRTHRVALLSLIVLVAVSGGQAMAATKIYRTVDEHGNVVFTDVPPGPEQRGDAVELEAPNSFEPAARGDSQMRLEEWLAQQRNDAGAGGDADETAATTRYQSLSIASPADDASIRDNAGNVTVSAALEPDLGAGHRLQLYLDGALAQSATTTTLRLTNVDRGTHNVELRVVDQSGNVLIASEPVVFHLHRRSVILQPANRAGN